MWNSARTMEASPAASCQTRTSQPSRQLSSVEVVVLSVVLAAVSLLLIAGSLAVRKATRFALRWNISIGALLRFLVQRNISRLWVWLHPLHVGARRASRWAFHRGYELAFLARSVLQSTSAQLTPGALSAASLADGRNRDALFHVARGQSMFLWIGRPGASDVFGALCFVRLDVASLTIRWSAISSVGLDQTSADDVTMGPRVHSLSSPTRDWETTRPKKHRNENRPPRDITAEASRGCYATPTCVLTEESSLEALSVDECGNEPTVRSFSLFSSGGTRRLFRKNSTLQRSLEVHLAHSDQFGRPQLLVLRAPNRHRT